jgi:hypothetical protein
MRVTPVGEERELARLLGGCLGKVRPAVATVHAEQRRQRVEIALAVLVIDVAALAAHDDRDLAFGVAAHAREVHPQMASGQPLQIAGFERGLGLKLRQIGGHRAARSANADA